jgi:hypothetical protein
MDGDFTNVIFRALQAWHMQSRIDGLASELRVVDSRRTPLSFTLYEEYSGRSMVETIRTRRSNYDGAILERRRELEGEVEAEVKGFCRWLEETKGLETDAAHYRAVSLKSVLLGLPTGLEIAQLFSIVLDKRSDDQTRNIH